MKDIAAGALQAPGGWRRWLPLATLAGGLTVTTMGSLNLHQTNQHRANRQFDYRVERLVVELQRQFSMPAEALKSVATLARLQPQVDTSGLQAYTQAIDQQVQARPMLGQRLGPYLPREALAARLEQAQLDAIGQAVRTSQPALTRQITLKHDPRQRSGYELVLPVYAAASAQGHICRARAGPARRAAGQPELRRDAHPGRHPVAGHRHARRRAA